MNTSQHLDETTVQRKQGVTRGEERGTLMQELPSFQEQDRLV